MGNVGIELGAAVFILDQPVLGQPFAALIAMGGSQMIFAAALRAVGRQLSAGHGYEGTIRTIDDLQIANDKTIVKGDRTKGLKSFAGIFHQLDANLGNFHGRSP